VSDQIELGIEKMNHGNWLKVTVPYKTNMAMTATLLSIRGELLKTVRLVNGNNLIDIEAMMQQSVRIRIDTPYEILSKELYLD
jgi:hypothetical protein